MDASAPVRRPSPRPRTGRHATSLTGSYPAQHAGRHATTPDSDDLTIAFPAVLRPGDVTNVESDTDAFPRVPTSRSSRDGRANG